MKYLFVLICLMGVGSLTAQTPLQDVPDRKLTLTERYQMIKTKSETFGEYKVIKEYVLDGVWKISQDTIKGHKATVLAARHSIDSLKSELQNIRIALQQKDASMEEMTFDSAHITLLGISFTKSTFVGMTTLVTVGLLLCLGIMSGRLRMMNGSVKEKSDLVNATTSELEEYKRKALEKQTKLSRELQNERNKLMELKRS